MTDDAIRAAVESADTYQAAAVALGMPYPKLYTAAHRLGVRPKKLAARKGRTRPIVTFANEARQLHDPTRKPAPESTPPHLGPWIAPSDRAAVKASILAVRLDQAGRVRAEIDALPGGGWCGWAVRDVSGAVVGKIGLTSGMRDGLPSTAQARQKAEEGADEALVALGWLPAGHTVSSMPCAMDAPVCVPATAEPDLSEEMLGALCAAFGAAAEIAIPAGWTEEKFVALARWCWQREVAAKEGRAA